MNRPAFKNSELGPIPADWEVKEIEQFYEIGSSKRVFQSQWRSSGIPFYRARDIVGFRRGEKAIGGLFIDKSLYEEFKRTYGVPAVDDLLVTAVGTLGNVFRVCDKSPFYFKDGNIIWFKSTGKYDSTLLEILFESGFLDAQIYDTAGGSTVGTYTISNAKKTLIPCPSLSEQHRIAAALSDVDAWIESLDKLIEKKKLVKQGAMQALLSGKTRLPGFSGEWVEKRLGEIGESIRGVGFRPNQSSQTSMPNSTKLLRANNIQDSSIILEDVVYVQNECIADVQKLQKGDILICAANGSRNLVGKAAVWSQNTSASFGAFMAVFRCAKGVDASFVGFLFQTASYRRQLDDILTGSAINNLNARDIEGLVFQLPSLAEQKAVASILSDIDAELSALSREKAKAERIKEGMMQELLTGRTRLGGSTARGEAQDGEGRDG